MGEKVWVSCGDKILRAMLFANGKAGNVGAGSGKRIDDIALAEHVAEIERVTRSEVVIQADAELVDCRLGSVLRGDRCVVAEVGQRIEGQERFARRDR